MSNRQIHVFARWKIKPGHLDTVLDLLKPLRENSIAEEGNLFYQVYQDNTDPNTIILYEGYASEAALDFHKHSAHYTETVVEVMPSFLAEREVHLTSPVMPEA